MWVWGGGLRWHSPLCLPLHTGRWDIMGVTISGSHVVFSREHQQWRQARDVGAALEQRASVLYNLITEEHQVKVMVVSRDLRRSSIILISRKILLAAESHGFTMVKAADYMEVDETEEDDQARLAILNGKRRRPFFWFLFKIG